MLLPCLFGEKDRAIQHCRYLGPVRNHVSPAAGTKANLWVNLYHREILDVYGKVRLMTMEDTRFLHCNIKTLNLIPAVIASQRAKEAGCFETVFHRNGRVTECAHSNVHILSKGKFITAPTDNLILPGIARKHLIAACGRLGIPVEGRPYDLTEPADADEIVVSSAGALCIPANELEGKAAGGEAPELLKAIQNEVLREFREQTA